MLFSLAARHTSERIVRPTHIIHQAQAACQNSRSAPHVPRHRWMWVNVVKISRRHAQTQSDFIAALLFQGARAARMQNEALMVTRVDDGFLDGKYIMYMQGRVHVLPVLSFIAFCLWLCGGSLLH